jgi:hypothetical protein
MKIKSAANTQNKARPNWRKALVLRGYHRPGFPKQSARDALTGPFLSISSNLRGSTTNVRASNLDRALQSCALLLFLNLNMSPARQKPNTHQSSTPNQNNPTSSLVSSKPLPIKSYSVKKRPPTTQFPKKYQTQGKANATKKTHRGRKLSAPPNHTQGTQNLR